MALEKHWISAEVGAGLVRRIKVIPICYGSLSIDELPSPISSREALKFDTNGLTSLFNTLSRFINLGLPQLDYDSISKDIIKANVTHLLIAGLANLTITNAWYGIPGRDSNVTDFLRTRVIGNRLRIQASNAVFGDPVPGEHKILHIDFSIGDYSFEHEVGEGEVMEIP